MGAGCAHGAGACLSLCPLCGSPVSRGSACPKADEHCRDLARGSPLVEAVRLGGGPAAFVEAMVGLRVVESPLLAEESVGFLVHGEGRAPFILARSAQRVA